MKKKLTRIMFAGLVAVFVSGTVLVPSMTPVFAAEQADQDQQMPPSDGSQDGNNDHAAHHHQMPPSDNQ